MGREALRAIVRRPDLELAGLMVHNRSKVGQDAGRLAGLDPVGVLATDRLEEILEMDADCVSYMPLPSAQVGEDPELDERVICRLLASGKNVVTVVGFVYPKARGPELVRRLEDACTLGQVSLHGTGANPGFIAEVMPLTLSGLCLELESLHVRDSSEFSSYPSRSIVVDVMGFTKPPDVYERDAARWRRFLSGLFMESLVMVADGLGMSIASVRQRDEVALARQRIEVAAGVIEVGTVCAQRWQWTAELGDRPLIRIESVYKAHPSVAPEWPDPGFAIRIEGKPSFTIELGPNWCTSEVRATAGHAVNAIPFVCDAAPGVRTFLDLPLLPGRGSVFSVPATR